MPGSAPIRVLTAAAALTMAGLLAGPALAEPPPWAPAHGHRDKHDHKHRDKHDHKDKHRHDQVAAPAYVLPPGLQGGRCEPSLLSGGTLGALLGAAGGGLLGSQIGSGSGQVAATAIGVVLGAVLGNQVGAGFDTRDERCLVGTLEHAPDGQAVAWRDPDGRDYRMTPVSSYQRDGARCRDYSFQAGRESQRGLACRDDSGNWRILE